MKPEYCVTHHPTQCYSLIYYIHTMKLTASCLLLIILLAAGCRMRIPYPLSEGYIQVGDSKIYYERGGGNADGIDPVILLHAGFLDANMWKDQVQEFKKHFPLVAIDIPGHGRTQNDTIRLQPADFIKVVMDSLQISKASFVGVSFGASCATEFAIAHPERVKKLVLVASGISGWETKFPYDTIVTKYLTSFFGLIENKDSVAAAEVFTQTWFDGPFRTPQQVNDSARRYVYETTLGNIRSHKVRGWPIFAEPPAINNLSKITGSTLIIHGDKDMPLITSTSMYLEKNIRGAKRIMIPGTGHMLNMEAPAQFNKAVIDFLD